MQCKVLALQPGIYGNVKRDAGDLFEIDYDAARDGRFPSWMRRMPDDAPVGKRFTASEKTGSLRLLCNGKLVYPLTDALDAASAALADQLNSLDSAVDDPDAPADVRLRALVERAGG